MLETAIHHRIAALNKAGPADTAYLRLQYQHTAKMAREVRQTAQGEVKSKGALQRAM